MQTLADQLLTAYAEIRLAAFEAADERFAEVVGGVGRPAVGEILANRLTDESGNRDALGRKPTTQGGRLESGTNPNTRAPSRSFPSLQERRDD